MVPKVRLLSVAIAVVLTVLVLACGASQSVAGNPTEIEFWHAMSRSRCEKLNELVNRFNSKNPGIVVKAKFIGAANPKLGNDYNALYGKILEYLARGNPPDVSQVYENWTTQLIEIGALTPVQNFVGGADGLTAQQIKDFVPVFKDANTFPNANGKQVLYTLPFNKSIYVLYYNKDIFQRLGIAAPRTWQELRTAAKKVSETGVTGLAFVPNVDIFGHYLYAHNGEYVTNDRVAFDTDTGVRDLEFWVELVHGDRSSLPTVDARNLFETGKAGMYIETTSRIGGFEKAGLNFGVTAIPRGEKSAYQFAGTNLAIFSHSSPAKQAAAWKFMRYLTSTDVTTEWAIATGYLPVRESAINSPTYRQYIARHPEYSVGIDALDKAMVQPRVPAWESIRCILDDAMYEALSRKYQPKDAIHKAASLSNDLLTSITGSGTTR